MKAVCRRCRSSYSFDDAKIPEEGLSYRCPRCGNTVLFTRPSPADQPDATDAIEDFAGEGGENPIVSGVYSGAIGGTGCAIPSVLMTLLGVGFMSIGLEISGYTAAAAMLLTFLRMLSLGVLIGASLAFISTRTDVDMWSFRGGLVGLAIGMLIGIVHGIFVHAIIGGVFGFIMIAGSVVGWVVKAVLVTIAVIIARKNTFFTYSEGSLSSELTGVQKAAVGTLFFLMVFTMGMEVKGLIASKESFSEAMKETSAEGLFVSGQEEFYNEEDDLIVTGSVENPTEDQKSGWYAVAELLNYNGDVIQTARVLNGTQSYSLKDIKTLKARDKNMKPEDLISPGKDIVIEPGGSVPLRIVFFEPPDTYEECRITLKDLDFNSMQELMHETLGDLKELKEMRDADK